MGSSWDGNQKVLIRHELDLPRLSTQHAGEYLLCLLDIYLNPLTFDPLSPTIKFSPKKICNTSLGFRFFFVRICNRFPTAAVVMMNVFQLFVRNLNTTKGSECFQAALHFVVRHPRGFFCSKKRSHWSKVTFFGGNGNPIFKGRYLFWDFFLFLVPWSPGPLIPWCPGHLVPLHLVPSLSGPQCPGPLVPWSSGPLVLWSPAPLVFWFPGPLFFFIPFFLTCLLLCFTISFIYSLCLVFVSSVFFVLFLCCRSFHAFQCVDFFYFHSLYVFFCVFFRLCFTCFLVFHFLCIFVFCFVYCHYCWLLNFILVHVLLLFQCSIFPFLNITC